MVIQRLRWAQTNKKRPDSSKTTSSMDTIVEAANVGDSEAACALFCELWRNLAGGRRPDPVLVKYFEPKFKKIAFFGMGLSLEPLEAWGKKANKKKKSVKRKRKLVKRKSRVLEDLNELFHLKRAWTADNPKGRGRKANGQESLRRTPAPWTTCAFTPACSRRPT